MIFGQNAHMTKCHHLLVMNYVGNNCTSFTTNGCSSEITYVNNHESLSELVIVCILANYSHDHLWLSNHVKKCGFFCFRARNVAAKVTHKMAF